MPLRIDSESELGKGAISEVGKYLLMEVCTVFCVWNMFVFMSVVVTVWGLWDCLLCSGHC